MSIIRLYHGTSGFCASEIIKDGFGGFEKTTIWDCSDSCLTYMYQLDKFIKCEGIEDDEFKDQRESCFQRANESAQITAALEKHPQDKTVVFEFIIDTDKVDTSNIVDDDSCENMEHYGAVQVPDGVLNYWIKNNLIQANIREYPFIVKMSLAYLSNVYKNEYLWDSLNNLSDEELSMLEALNKEGFFCEELMFPEVLREYSL